MFKKKERKLIPNTEETQKKNDKSSHFENYHIGGIDDKVQLTIRSFHTEKASYDVHGTFLYKIKNLSHFEIDVELDFADSVNFRTQENNNFEPNKTVFKKHIEPFEDIINKQNQYQSNNLNNSSNYNYNYNDDESGICKVQYNRGYLINAKLRCSFTFPSVEKQQSYVENDHREIKEMLCKWKKYKPSYIEYLLMFNESDSYKDIFKFNDKETLNNNNNNNNHHQVGRKTKYITPLLEYNNNDNNDIRFLNDRNEKMYKDIQGNNEHKPFFVDESFPPCQIEQHIIDLSKEIKTNPDLSNTESENEKKKTIIFHYRPIEHLLPNPNEKQIIKKNDFIPYDIQFGIIKNQNIISIFAHLADFPKYIYKLFPDNKINDFGIYKVKLFLMGTWTTVFIDKFIPCFPMYFPIYTYSPNVIWPCLLEKAIAKTFGGYNNIKQLSFFELYQILTGLPVYNFTRINDNKYILNSNLNTIASQCVSKDDIIEIITSKNNCLMAVYASKEFVRDNYNKDKIHNLSGKVFPIINGDRNGFQIKSIYNYQLKKYINSNSNNIDLLELSWSAFKTLFDSIIIIKTEITHEIHFRNGFIRCLDIESPDYDRILAHTYYELNISKKGRSTKEPVTVTIVLNLGNDHFLDESYLCNEMDMKIGVIQLIDKQPSKSHSQQQQKELNNQQPYDPFKGKNPIYFDSPDFVIGYSLIYELKLYEGEYIIVPMTMGYCMQKNNNIRFKDYSLRDNKDNKLLPIQHTIIPKFLDNIFYLNDPFCKHYLPFKVVQQITSQLVDNNGKKVKPIDEKMFNAFIHNSIFPNDNKYNKTNINSNNNINTSVHNIMPLLLFKDFLYDQMNLINEEHKKQSMQNLGYENNTYPYLSRFVSVNFYFNSDNEVFDIKLIPKNNLIDNNMDSIVNIRQLEKKLFEFKNAEIHKPLRVNLRKDNSWYTLEGVYMKKGKEQVKLSYKERLYSFIPERNVGDVFYSTYKYNVKTIINPGKLLFVMYVVDNVLGRGNGGNECDEENKSYIIDMGGVGGNNK